MPGLLSTLFDTAELADREMQADDDTGFDADPQGGASDNDGGEQSQSSQYDAGADGGIDLSPTVGVSHSAEASWEDPEGTTHTYSSDTDLVFTADVDAAFGAAGSLGRSSIDEG